MKKKLIITALIVMCMVLFALSLSAAAPVPQKPDLGVDFGEVSTIEGFTPPSQLYVNTTERVLLTDGNGNYVTYPTYYITKDSTTFDVDFSKINDAQSIQYSKESVVMLELPKGVLALTSRYFSDSSSRFTKCVSVQIPGTVQDYQKELFFRNMTVRIVEFLDGTTPVTLGERMFGGDNTGGSRGTAVEYVKFPNNMVSIGGNTFYKNTSSKTIIFGENLETIGSSLFVETTPSTTDTHIYVSNKFFSDTTKLFNDLFGGLSDHHNKHLRLTIFYTGTQAEAETLIEAGKALQSKYVYDRVSYVNASEYDYATHKPTVNGSITLVYDYNKCDAFYNGVHQYDDSNPCVKACVKNCGLGTIEHCDSDSETFTISYDNGYSNKGVKHTTCTNKGCTLDKKEDTLPLFATEGYSTPESGRGDIAILYTVNYDEIEEYEKASGKSLKFGAFAVAYEKIGDDGILGNDNAVCVDIDRKAGYGSFEMRISGFETNEYRSAPISIGGYVIDGENVSYLQAVAPKEGDTYHYISYNDIFGASSEESTQQ